MQKTKPSWFCRACQWEFHFVCFTPGSCSQETSDIGLSGYPDINNHFQREDPLLNDERSDFRSGKAQSNLQ